jgi:hypothetical protein
MQPARASSFKDDLNNRGSSGSSSTGKVAFKPGVSATSSQDANTPVPRAKGGKARNSLSVSDAISKVLLQTSSEVEIVAGSKETGMLALEDNFRTR